MEVKTKQKNCRQNCCPRRSVHLSWKKDMINVRWEGRRILRMDKSIIKVINTREGITEKVTFSQSGCGGVYFRSRQKARDGRLYSNRKRLMYGNKFARRSRKQGDQK